jgi:hypothetical protein
MEAKLCYIGHALMENRNGLLVDMRLSKQCSMPSRPRARRSALASLASQRHPSQTMTCMSPLRPAIARMDGAQA